MVSLAKDVDRLRIQPSEGNLEFFAFTLTADEAGQLQINTQTCWIGFADDEQRIELREARLVNRKMGELWESLGTPCLYIVDPDDLGVFFLVGGHALIERTVAEMAVPEWLEPQECFQDGLSGFIDANIAGSTALRRAPTPKLRMKVLTRDKRRCRICGRNPDDNADLVLNVHHILPWGQRGVTIPNNLITLCHTCHDGLDPHFDPALYGYLDSRNSSSYAEQHDRGVLNFQKFAYAAMLVSAEKPFE